MDLHACKDTTLYNPDTYILSQDAKKERYKTFSDVHGVPKTWSYKEILPSMNMYRITLKRRSSYKKKQIGQLMRLI